MIPKAPVTFIEDLANRLANRIQLTSDGLKMYVKAVDKAFGGDVEAVQVWADVDEGVADMVVYASPAPGLFAAISVEKDREPYRIRGLYLLCLQLHQDSSHPPHDACDGRWCDRSALESVGLGCRMGSRRAGRDSRINVYDKVKTIAE